MSSIKRRVARRRGQRRDRTQPRRVVKQVRTYRHLLAERFRDRAKKLVGKTRSAKKLARAAAGGR